MNNYDENNNSNEDTMYFGDDRNYENNTNPPYTEEEMYENYRPMTNTNSVEYDENDYESNYEDDNLPTGKNKRIIVAYIVALLLICVVILLAIIKNK